MLTLRRLGIYLVTFILAVSIVIGLVDLKGLDKFLVSEASKKSAGNGALNKELVFINLEKPKTGSEGESFKLFRQHTIKLLNSIAEETKAKMGPRGVVLDTWFSNDTTELENLKTALKNLKDLKIPVYAAYNINENHEHLDIGKIDFDDIETIHAVDIYNDYLAGSEGTASGSGRYHTFFYPEENLANYENDIYLVSSLFGDSVLIESLANRVAMDLNNAANSGQIRKREGSIVPSRRREEIEKKTYTFIAGTAESRSEFRLPEGLKDSIDLTKNILVVGDAVNDLMDMGNGKKIPGPYIVAWALSDLLNNNLMLKLPLENLYVIVGQILFFSFFTVLIFALLFKYIKWLQTRPALIAGLAFIIAMGFFYMYGLLIYSFNVVIPVSQTMIASLAAALLSLHFTHKFLVTIITTITEGAEKYDVFISYSHSQSEWVKKNVFEPLAAYRKPNGKELKIFFDEKNIGVGEAFTSKYMWAIVYSTYFVPVISEDYYDKPHCKNEIDLAYRRQIEQKKVSIMGIAFSFEAIPKIYRGLIMEIVPAERVLIEKITQNFS